MKVLTGQEFSKLIDFCPPYVQPVVMIAYYMGMRKSEIIHLSLHEVDLRKRFIRLSAERTKTDQSRVIPIHPSVHTIPESLPRGLHNDRVFLRDGKPFNDFKHSFATARNNAGIEDFTFHDLRHCALTFAGQGMIFLKLWHFQAIKP